MNLDEDGRAVLSFAAGAERYAELLENEGVVPAPYFARIYWVALERWDALRSQELRESLAQARERVYAKLPRRTKDLLELPAAKRKKAIAERRKISANGVKKRPSAT